MSNCYTHIVDLLIIYYLLFIVQNYKNITKKLLFLIIKKGILDFIAQIIKV